MQNVLTQIISKNRKHNLNFGRHETHIYQQNELM